MKLDKDTGEPPVDETRAASQTQPQSPPESIEPVLPEDVLGILPVRDMVLFPGFIAPISIGRPASIAAASGRCSASTIHCSPARWPNAALKRVSTTSLARGPSTPTCSGVQPAAGR